MARASSRVVTHNIIKQNNKYGAITHSTKETRATKNKNSSSLKAEGGEGRLDKMGGRQYREGGTGGGVCQLCFYNVVI